MDDDDDDGDSLDTIGSLGPVRFNWFNVVHLVLLGTLGPLWMTWSSWVCLDSVVLFSAPGCIGMIVRTWISWFCCAHLVPLASAGLVERTYISWSRSVRALCAVGVERARGGRSERCGLCAGRRLGGRNAHVGQEGVARCPHSARWSHVRHLFVCARVDSRADVCADTILVVR